MIRLSVFSPSTDGAPFDHDSSRDSHVPPCVTTWGLSGAEIDEDLDGPCVAAGAVMADVPNATAITPVLQTSEVVA